MGSVTQLPEGDAQGWVLLGNNLLVGGLPSPPRVPAQPGSPAPPGKVMTFILASIPAPSDPSLSPQALGACPPMPEVWGSAGFGQWPWTRVAFCLMWLVRYCFNICCLSFLGCSMWGVAVSAPRVVLGTKRACPSLEQPSARGPLATAQRLEVEVCGLLASVSCEWMASLYERPVYAACIDQQTMSYSF